MFPAITLSLQLEHLKCASLDSWFLIYVSFIENVLHLLSGIFCNFTQNSKIMIRWNRFFRCNQQNSRWNKRNVILENFHSELRTITVLWPLSKSSAFLLISWISVRWLQFKAVCGFAHAPTLLFYCSFLKCGKRQDVILISSFQKITFRKLRVSVGNILEHKWQILDSITEFRTDTNADQMTFTYLYLAT